MPIENVKGVNYHSSSMEMIPEICLCSEVVLQPQASGAKRVQGLTHREPLVVPQSGPHLWLPAIFALGRRLQVQG